ncbi:MAG: hypothetical protein KDB22_30540, partial [Planctomycetales bacterium]|nr:hypothetical protein [Planctomycetales bacterium]
RVCPLATHPRAQGWPDKKWQKLPILNSVGKENLLRSFGKNFGCHQSKGVQQWLHHGRVLLIDASPDFLLLPEAFIWDESIGSKNIEKK